MWEEGWRENEFEGVGFKSDLCSKRPPALHRPTSLAHVQRLQKPMSLSMVPSSHLHLVSSVCRKTTLVYRQFVYLHSVKGKRMQGDR